MKKCRTIFPGNGCLRQTAYLPAITFCLLQKPLAKPLSQLLSSFFYQLRCSISSCPLCHHQIHTLPWFHFPGLCLFSAQADPCHGDHRLRHRRHNFCVPAKNIYLILLCQTANLIHDPFEILFFTSFWKKYVQQHSRQICSGTTDIICHAEKCTVSYSLCITSDRIGAECHRNSVLQTVYAAVHSRRRRLDKALTSICNLLSYGPL